MVWQGLVHGAPLLFTNVPLAAVPFRGQASYPSDAAFLMVIGQPKTSKTSLFYHHIYPHSPMTVDMMVNMTVNMTVTFIVISLIIRV